MDDGGCDNWITEGPKGDLDALCIETDLGYYTGSMILGYDSIAAQYRCVVRGYAPCKRIDAVGGK